MYHAGAVYGGGAAGVALVIGLGLLIYRRRRNSQVFKATTWNDKLMYLVLATVIGVGLVATLTGDTTPTGAEHDYRDTVSVWFRSLIVFQPNIDAMASATWQFKVHVTLGLLLIAMIPFTRLIHAFTAPLHYLFRPYIVYRSRDEQPRTPTGDHDHGWAPVGTPDNTRRRR